MKIIYKPRIDATGNLISGQTVGVALLVPDSPRQKYILEIAIHGIGEVSQGGIENLKNLVEGFDWNNDGIRDSGFVTADMKKAVDQYGIIIAIPTYPNFFEPSMVNFVYDQVKALYPIHDKMLLTGFSLGGGSVFKYITSSLANAGRVAYAVPVAAVYSIQDRTIPGKVNLPVHAFSCNPDPRVPSSNTKNQINAINESNPSPRALYTFFNKNDHGGNIEAWSLTPPKAPGGDGFTDAAENIYQVVTDIINNGPRQMKSGAIQPVPGPPPPEPIPEPVDLKADFNLTDGQIVTSQVLDIDASASTGVKTGWDAYQWDIKPVTGSWDFQLKNGAYTDKPTQRIINLNKNGTYSISLTVRDSKGNTATKKITITVNLTGKVITAFDSATDLITYSDGSTEKGSAVYSGGNWVIKNSAGQIVST
jgi:hypothetical protein